MTGPPLSRSKIGRLMLKPTPRLRQRPWSRRLSGASAMPSSIACALGADVDLLALPEDLAGGRREAAEEALHEFAAPGADQAVEADDLAARAP